MNLSFDDRSAFTLGRMAIFIVWVLYLAAATLSYASGQFNSAAIVYAIIPFGLHILLIHVFSLFNGAARMDFSTFALSWVGGSLLLYSQIHLEPIVLILLLLPLIAIVLEGYSPNWLHYWTQA